MGCQVSYCAILSSLQRAASRFATPSDLHDRFPLAVPEVSQRVSFGTNAEYPEIKASSVPKVDPKMEAKCGLRNAQIVATRCPEILFHDDASLPPPTSKPWRPPTQIRTAAR